MENLLPSCHLQLAAVPQRTNDPTPHRSSFYFVFHFCRRRKQVGVLSHRGASAVVSQRQSPLKVAESLFFWRCNVQCGHHGKQSENQKQEPREVPYHDRTRFKLSCGTVCGSSAHSWPSPSFRPCRERSFRNQKPSDSTKLPLRRRRSIAMTSRLDLIARQTHRSATRHSPAVVSRVCPTLGR